MSPFRAFVFFVLVIRASSSHYMHPLSDEFIDFINSNQTSWRAARNFHRNTPRSYLKKLAGTIKSNAGFDDPPPPDYADVPTRYIPYQFDARDKWKYCPSISDIRDQGACASCWAVSATSAMSDRLCIKSRGQQRVYFSEFDVMSCCMRCGSACKMGGVLREAWRYGVHQGIVSGGKYNSGEGCKPTKVPPCEHPKQHSNRPPCGHNIPSTVCHRQCQPNYWKRYKDDQRRLAYYYRFTDIEKIMAEIYKNGPVTTVFDLREDFYSYKSGVYRHVTGKSDGYHSVKVIGWGEEGGVPYWLAANSWNTDWGDRGFFKIIRGINHLGIEDEMYAGLFRV